MSGHIEGDARVTEESSARGAETYGHLNQHPALEQTEGGFRVGVSMDRNRRCRRTMEDAHSFIYDFAGLKGQGYFAVFDGHAGKKAAEFCGLHFHEYLLENLRKSSATPIPHLLNATFHAVDTALSTLSASEGSHSGCTAVTCLLRLEDEDGNPVGAGSGVGPNAVGRASGSIEGKAGEAAKAAEAAGIDPTEGKPGSGEGQGIAGNTSASTSSDEPGGLKSKLKSVLSGSGSKLNAAAGGSPSPPSTDEQINGPAEVVKAAKRTLYTANAGDARAVLSRNGRAIRLSYDHKGSDEKEIQRVEAAGGYVMNQRVNGYLAVTRSLGDSQMKQFVVGSPYTTETTLRPDDDFLIVACDGLWDVCSDQQAVDALKGLTDPQQAADTLLQYALSHGTTDNLTCMVIALNYKP
ncbi:mgpp2cl-1, protein phosphatase 2C-like protein 1 [Rhodotorula kratochvilovae]